MTETPEQRDARIRANIAKMRAQHAPDDDIETYLRDVEHLGAPAAPARAPTGHAGKKFVDAPEMKQQHAGKPFVDAEPEPSYASKALGGLASLGRYVADDTQTTARALTREHGIADLAKGIGHTGVDDVVRAVRFGTLGAGSFLSDKLEATPSYSRARADIHHAEDTAGDVGTYNKAAGAAVGFAPLATSLAGAVKGGLAPLGAKLSNGLPGKMAKGAYRGLVGAEAPVMEGVRPAQGLQGPMADVAEAVKGQDALESGAAIARPVTTARPPIGAPPAPSSVTEVQSPMESAADLTRNHPIAADVVKTVDAVNAPAAAPNVAAKVGRQSHRTKASFQDMAKRMGAEPAPVHQGPVPNETMLDETATPEPDLGALLRQSLNHVKILRSLGLKPALPPSPLP